MYKLVSPANGASRIPGSYYIVAGKKAPKHHSHTQINTAFSVFLSQMMILK